jgi:transposase InsO family protein
VTESGFYAWRSRPTSPRALRRIFLAGQIAEVHRDSAGVDGAHRITAELRFGRQIVASHNAVSAIMRELGIKGLPNRRLPRSARVDRAGGPDLVRRQFARKAPDQLWMTDISEHPTREGKISRGIHPAILSDAGLDDALAALARRSPIRVDLDVSFRGRYDPTLEATVYYVAAESITNAVKHAQASTFTVRGGRRDGAIELEISDDGIGGTDPRRGTGLIGLKDRVDTLGGTISFASPPAPAPPFA